MQKIKNVDGKQRNKAIKRKEGFMMSKEFEDLTPGSKKNRRQDLLSQLKGIEEEDVEYSHDNSSFLPSSLFSNKTPSKSPTSSKKKDNDDEDPKNADEWFDELIKTSNIPMTVSKRGGGRDLFEAVTTKKKKKKKKDTREATDFKKEFEPELALYRNLLQDQNRFTDSLQREFDNMKSAKSSSRGVSKVMTDLVKNITEARGLSMQLVEKHVNAKKLITELSLKEKKELGTSLGEGDSMSDYAASCLKAMISDRQSFINSEGSEISDYSDDDLFNELSASLGETNRSEDVNRYLKYENRNVTVYAVINAEDAGDYDYIAKDEEDIAIDDYPLPNKTELSINHSTNVATDKYGKKYPIIWK